MTERGRRRLKVAGGAIASLALVHGLVVLAAEGRAIDAWPAGVSDFRHVALDHPAREGNAAAAVLDDLALAVGVELRKRKRRGAPSVDDLLEPARTWRLQRSEPLPPQCDAWLAVHEAEIDAVTALLLRDEPRWAQGLREDGTSASDLPLRGVNRLGMLLWCRALRDAELGRQGRAREGVDALLALARSMGAHPEASHACMQSFQYVRALRVLRDLPCTTVADVDAVRMTSRAFMLEEAWRADAYGSWRIPRGGSEAMLDELGVAPAWRWPSRLGRPAIRWDVARVVASNGRVLSELRRATPSTPGVEMLTSSAGGEVTSVLLMSGLGCSLGMPSASDGEIWARQVWDVPAERALTRRVAELRALRRDGALPAQGRVSGAEAGLPGEWALVHEVGATGRLHVSLAAVRPWSDSVMEWTER